MACAERACCAAGPLTPLHREASPWCRRPATQYSLITPPYHQLHHGRGRLNRRLSTLVRRLPGRRQHNLHRPTPQRQAPAARLHHREHSAQRWGALSSNRPGQSSPILHSTHMQIDEMRPNSEQLAPIDRDLMLHRAIASRSEPPSPPCHSPARGIRCDAASRTDEMP